MMDALTQPATRAPAAPLDDALVFVSDPDSEGVIRHALGDLGVARAEFTPGTIDTAIAQLAHRPSPRLLVADITGIEDPAARTDALAAVCEPGTGVVLIGEVNDVRVYRDLKSVGVAEYFFKPLVNDLLKRSFSGVFSGTVYQANSRTGKLVIALGVRGGSGATMIAATAAWHLSEVLQRRVALVDLDLQFGDAALQFDAAPSHALTEALQHPDRVDDLFLERGIIRVSDRLALLASLEPIGATAMPDEAAILSLLDTLLRRYRYVFVDLPPMLAPRLMRVLHLPGTVLFVSTGNLVCARDAGRWRDAIGANTAERTVMRILNRSGAHGSLTPEEFARVSGHALDMIIPYSREVGLASNMGIRAVHKCGSLKRELAPLLRHLAGEAVAGSRPSLFHRMFG